MEPTHHKQHLLASGRTYSPESIVAPERTAIRYAAFSEMGFHTPGTNMDRAAIVPGSQLESTEAIALLADGVTSSNENRVQKTGLLAATSSTTSFPRFLKNLARFTPTSGLLDKSSQIQREEALLWLLGDGLSKSCTAILGSFVSKHNLWSSAALNSGNDLIDMLFDGVNFEEFQEDGGVFKECYTIDANSELPEGLANILSTAPLSEPDEEGLQYIKWDLLYPQLKEFIDPYLEKLWEILLDDDQSRAQVLIFASLLMSAQEIGSRIRESELKLSPATTLTGVVKVFDQIYIFGVGDSHTLAISKSGSNPDLMTKEVILKGFRDDTQVTRVDYLSATSENQYSPNDMCLIKIPEESVTDYMFVSISDGILGAYDLDELKTHLREEIDELTDPDVEQVLQLVRTLSNEAAEFVSEQYSQELIDDATCVVVDGASL